MRGIVSLISMAASSKHTQSFVCQSLLGSQTQLGKTSRQASGSAHFQQGGT